MHGWGLGRCAGRGQSRRALLFPLMLPLVFMQGQQEIRMVRIDGSREYSESWEEARMTGSTGPLFDCRQPRPGEGCFQANGTALDADAVCSGHGSCVHGWCECQGNYLGQTCEHNLEDMTEYMPALAASKSARPAWVCAQVCNQRADSIVSRGDGMRSGDAFTNTRTLNRENHTPCAGPPLRGLPPGHAAPAS